MDLNETGVYQPVYNQFERDDSIITAGALFAGATFIAGFCLALFKHEFFWGPAMAFGGPYCAFYWMIHKLDSYNPQLFDGSEW